MNNLYLVMAWWIYNFFFFLNIRNASLTLLASFRGGVSFLLCAGCWGFLGVLVWLFLGGGGVFVYFSFLFTYTDVVRYCSLIIVNFHFILKPCNEF